MALIRGALYTYLTAQTGVTSIIGDRMYPTIRPKSAKLPALVYRLIDQRAEQHLTAAASLTFAGFILSCWANKDTVAEDLADALRLELDGFQGLMGSVDVRRAIIRDNSDSMDLLQDGSEQPAFNIDVDLDLWYQSDVPTF